MTPQTAKALAMLCAGILASASAWAQGAPGEDPVQIHGKINYLQMPTTPRSVSSSIVYKSGMPDDAKAKIAHYVAKAYSANTEGIKTNKDVVSSVQTNGMGSTTCVQTVQPSKPGGAGKAGDDQVVVITGDLVNVCR